MKRVLAVATETESAATAIERLGSRDVGALIVLSGGRLCGILSERDILRRVIERGRDPYATRVGDVATSNPVAVAEETPLAECARLLRESGFRHLPVVDAERRPLGMISSRDLLDYAIHRTSC